MKIKKTRHFWNTLSTAKNLGNGNKFDFDGEETSKMPPNITGPVYRQCPIQGQVAAEAASSPPQDGATATTAYEDKS